MSGKMFLIGLAGAATIATSLFVAQPSANETAAREPASGPYRIEVQPATGNVWVVDTRTGAVRICLPPRDASAGRPECTPWQNGGR